MSHPRALIRQDLVRRLGTDKDVREAGGQMVHVEDTRAAELAEEDLPAVLIFVDQDQVVGLDNTSPREEHRRLELRISCIARADAGADVQDFLDELAEAVERAVIADETHGGNASATTYERTTAAWRDESQTVIAALNLHYSVDYHRTYEPRDLVPAEHVHVDIDIESETPGQIEAQADFELPQ